MESRRKFGDSVSWKRTVAQISLFPWSFEIFQTNIILVNKNLKMLKENVKTLFKTKRDKNA